jgi:hypothetical protein
MPGGTRVAEKRSRILLTVAESSLPMPCELSNRITAFGGGGFRYRRGDLSGHCGRHGRVKVKGNWYSTPLYPGSRVTARAWPAHIEVRRESELAARHERSYGHGHHILNLEHYLDVLEKKPGAIRNSTPLQQWRAAGRWPAFWTRSGNNWKFVMAEPKAPEGTVTFRV